MKSGTGVALSLALFASSPALVLAKCAPVCHADNCARAVTGTRQGPVFTSQAKVDCSSFVVTTSYGHTSTVTAPAPSSVVVEKVIPEYASACSGPAAYASACSCYGIKSHVVTETDGTTIVTVPPVSSSSPPSIPSSSPIPSSSSIPSSSPIPSSSSIPSSSTSSAPPPGCTGGLTDCGGGTCLDIRSDPANCGGCGVTCDSGTCSNGACSLNSCAGQTCDTFTACGPGGSCVCAAITGGTGFCADGQTPCSGLADCATSADCPLGSVCAVGTCCTRNVCIRADTCGGFTTNSPERLFMPREVHWENATIGHPAGYIEA
ncbi:hypothetical protein B0H66DRAFT_163614 [Apodospora peruviana]|uniref:4Fe-4S ferredoxin-type domain-containing protein n=1 Tax=Apodospora peruviana TaxID=516989 RepID=A0AAE0MD11_9PEZI|nr:hypothetical protein B0H66DRAFT_163614 [Apodospora peruviana]